jgi:predicted Zn-dependent peptidase
MRPYLLKNMEPIKKIILPNGLRLILAPREGVTATALILVDSGSEYETKRTNGVAHFLEHLVFKGTKTRPHSSIINDTLDGLGAQYNAFTLPDSTGYYAKARKEKLPQLLDLVSDMYLEPLFDPAELEKERGVIVEEINMREDLPGWKAHYLFMETLYGDQPAGWKVSGTKETVLGITREDVLNYRTERYHPASTIITVAGDFDAKEVEDFVVSRFGGLAAQPSPAKPQTIEAQDVPKVKVILRPNSEQMQLMLGVRSFPVMDPRRHAAEVLAHVLGGGMSSRLFKRIREDMGAAYSVDADSRLSSDHGYFAISAGVTPAKLEEAVSAALGELIRLKTEPVPEAELRKVKDHLIGIFMLSLETSDSLAEYYADQELFTRDTLSPEEVAAKIEAVTAAELQALANDLFIDRSLNLAVVGPSVDVDRLQGILHF